MIAFLSNRLYLRPESTKFLRSKLARYFGTNPLKSRPSSVCLQYSPIVRGYGAAMLSSSLGSEENIGESPSVRLTSLAAFLRARAVLLISESNGNNDDPELRIHKHEMPQ